MTIALRGVQQVRKKFPNFPDEPISNQFYSPQQSEAYRQLGYHIGKLVCRELPPWRDHPDFAVTNLPCGENTPSLPPQLRPLLSPQELESRLVLSYLTECQLEQTHDHSEVSVDRLFAPHRHDPERFDLRCKAAFPVEKEFMNPRLIEQAESELQLSHWLSAYEQDADIRLAIRWFVYHSICGRGVPFHKPVLGEFQKLIDQNPDSPGPRFLIAPIAVAVNELLVSDDSAHWINLSIDDGIWQGAAVPVVSTQGTRPLASGAATFRIGGREILVNPLKEDHDIKDRAVGFTQSERRRSFRIAYDVFRAHGPATAMLTAHCLLRLRASSHEAKDAKDNGIYNREPVWSELRESLATHNQQEFERVLQNFEAAPVD